MSRPPAPKVPHEALCELEGLPYQWVCGAKHWHLRISGELVAIWPHGSARANYLNLRACIRRFKKAHHRDQ